jgi:hypothetical protein
MTKYLTQDEILFHEWFKDWQKYASGLKSQDFARAGFLSGYNAQQARIAALEAQNAELIAALEGMIYASNEAFKDTGYPAVFHSGFLSKARAVLAKVTK